MIDEKETMDLDELAKIECPENPRFGRKVVLAGFSGKGISSRLIKAGINLDKVVFALGNPISGVDQAAERLSFAIKKFEPYPDYDPFFMRGSTRKETPANYIHKKNKRAIYKKHGR